MRDWDYSIPLDIGNVARRLVVKHFIISDFVVFQVLRNGIAEVAKL
jgi:hypothetical protein